MSRVLVLAAHPDDEVLGMGGTIALHAARGDEMRIVCVTDGSSTQYPGDTDLRERKSDEAKRAAAELGVEDYVHLALPDMRLDTVAHVDVNRPVRDDRPRGGLARKGHRARRPHDHLVLAEIGKRAGIGPRLGAHPVVQVRRARLPVDDPVRGCPLGPPTAAPVVLGDPRRTALEQLRD